jgi:hypothetical protein
MEEIITKKEFIDRYKICRRTFENWMQNRGLPVVEVSSHSKFIKNTDLVKWENEMKKK